jgi:hypothetical protein
MEDAKSAPWFVSSGQPASIENLLNIPSPHGWRADGTVRAKTPNMQLRPGSRSSPSRPRTREALLSREASRPNTRGSIGASSSRASTPQLVEPMKTVSPRTAGAAALLSFQIRHIGSRENSRGNDVSSAGDIPPLPYSEQVQLKFPPIDMFHNEEKQRRQEKRDALRKQKQIARSKRLKALKTGVNFNAQSLFKMIRHGITPNSTPSEIRDMVEGRVEESVVDHFSPPPKRHLQILEYDTATTDEESNVRKHIPRLKLTQKHTVGQRARAKQKKMMERKTLTKTKTRKRTKAHNSYYEQLRVKYPVENLEKRRRVLERDVEITAAGRPVQVSLGDGLSFTQSLGEFFSTNREGIRSLKSPRSMSGIPMEMLVREDVLTELTKNARQDRRNIGTHMQDKVDKVLLSLPSEFLFSMRLESYATMKGIGSITRVLKRLITGVVEEAWSRWWTLVLNERERLLQEARDRFRMQKGRDALEMIFKRLTFGELFRGFNGWKRASRKIYAAKRRNAATNIQRMWRGILGRRFHFDLKINLEKWKRTILLLDWAERRWRLNRAAERSMLKKQTNAACQITRFFRLVIAKNSRLARQKAKEQAELEARMALRVQCAWRCRQGRFSLFLKREAEKLREEEERIAAITIQSLGRGWQGRRAAKQRKQWKENEGKAKQMLLRMFKKALFMCFSAWQSWYLQKRRLKALMQRSFQGIKGRLFITWRENAKSLIQARLESQRREEELRRAELRRKRKEEEDRQKVLAALKRMQHRVLAMSFDTLVANWEQMKELKRRILLKMVQSERNMFQRWVQFVQDEKQMRADSARRREIEEARRQREAERLRREQERKIKMALNRMFNRILCASFSGWSDYTARMRRVKNMMRRALMFKQRQRFDHWWDQVEERRAQMATASVYLKRMLNRRVYVTFESWAQYYRQMRSVKQKMKMKLMGKKQYTFLKWTKFAIVEEVIRHLQHIKAFKATRTRLVGLSKARTKVLEQTMELLPDEYEREDMIVLREAVYAVTHFQELEERMALRVQAAWRGKTGRLAYQMKMHAKREREAEELAATLKMQKLLRGVAGRKKFKMAKEQRIKDELKAKYVRERQRELDREKWYREAEEVAMRESMLNKKRAEEELEQARLRMEKQKLEAEQAKWAAEQKRLEAEANGWGPGGSGGQQSHSSGWIMVPDEDNNIYYYNEKTGASQWERPAELGGPEATTEEEAWIELPAGDGKTYWYNTISHASSWEDPRVSKSRAPKFEPTFCDVDACIGKETRAVRACEECKKNFCLACYIEQHRSQKKANHEWKPVLQPSNTTLMCRKCPGVAERFCQECDENYCENCFLWEHAEGLKKKHESKAFLRGAPVCVECENKIGEVMCVECSDVFCEKCYKKAHRSGNKRSHTANPLEIFKEILGDGEEYCIRCEIRAADRACDSCGDPYCAKCFDADHNKGYRSEHTWTSWKKLNAGKDWVEIVDDESGRVLYFNIKTRQTTEKKPLGLMSGKERANTKKRQAAEREMKVRLEKEAELLGLREKMEEAERLAKLQEEELAELRRAKAPEEGKKKKKGWFSRESKAEKAKMQKLKKSQTKEFLKDRLITKERQKELDEEKNQFGSELYERSVLEGLTISTPEVKKK